MTAQPAARLLAAQGFGTRRACEALIAAGRLRVRAAVVSDPAAPLALAEGEPFEVDGTPWPYHAKALVLLHKPAGYECSQRPGRWPSVMSLLPPPLRTRGVQPVGRLDADTTGLLLLTDDGPLLHRLTSPRHHVPKVYEVRCKHPVTPAQLAALTAGVVLHDDPAPVAASAAVPTGSHTLQLTISQGRYHQVKRMLAAVGNRVEALHRSAIGPLTLPPDLAAGQWRWLAGLDGTRICA